MNKAKRPFRYRQMTTTIILLFVLILVAGVNVYLFTRPAPEVVVAQTGYDVEEDVQAAMSRLYNLQPGDTAQLVTRADDGITQKAELIFEGLPDLTVMQSILNLLSQYEAKASFYFSGTDALNNAYLISMPVKAGYNIGSSGYSFSTKYDALSEQDAITNLCRANLMLEIGVGMQPGSLLCNKECATEALLSYAYACNIKTVIEPTDVLQYYSFSNEDEVVQYFDNLNRGSILCINLSGTGEAQTAGSAGETTRAKANEALLQTVEWVLRSNQNTDLERIATQLATDNQKALATPQSRIYTTERAACFTFSGFGNKAELSNLLQTLDTLKATALFYVTLDEIEKYPEEIRLALMYGHDLGVMMHVVASDSVQTLEMELLLAKEKLRSEFDYSNAQIAMQAAGEPTDALREAVSATGFTLLSYLTNAVRSEDSRVTSAQTVFGDLFKTDTKLQRGHIVYYKMNTFTQSNTVLGDLVRLIAQKQSIYPIRSALALTQNQELSYHYPLTDEQILPERLNAIHPGQLTGSMLREIQTRYIGADWITTSAYLPGFTREEIATLDQKGVIRNEDRTAFLTFDDWGTDQPITALLDVLEKHGVKATFFIRAENVVYNPNLLRTIAMAGHDVASHTNTHYRLSTPLNEQETKFDTLTAQEGKALEADLVACYETLQRTVGDVVVGGRPALTLLFRPPTMAVSKLGLQTVFDCGFTYSVSGSFSTQDYKAESAQKLAALLQEKTRTGTIVIMHMSDNSVYTAEALDIFLSKEALKPVAEQLHFGLLQDYLQ